MTMEKKIVAVLGATGQQVYRLLQYQTIAKLIKFVRAAQSFSHYSQTKRSTTSKL